MILVLPKLFRQRCVAFGHEYPNIEKRTISKVNNFFDMAKKV